MRRVDILSHLLEYVDGKEDNKDIVLLDPKLFIGAMKLMTLNEDVLSRIWAKEEFLEESVEKGLATRSSEWERSDNLIYREGHIYVPKDQVLWGDIIQLHHDTPIAGHPSQYKTYELITRNYWWHGLQQDVNRYITRCETCQRTKAR